jgi:aromatic-L-amino-acid decarboxylase
VEAIRARLRRDLANAAWLAEAVRAEPGWRVVAPVALQTVCIRHEPPGLVGDGGDGSGDMEDGEALDRHTLAWAAAVNASGQAFLTPSVLAGRWMVRVSIGSETTERADVAATWDLIRATAAECAASRSSPTSTV